MVNMLLFFMIVYGISTIISSEYLTSPFIDKFKEQDRLYYLLTCNKCLSVWVGLIVSLFGFGIVHPLVDPFAAYTATCLLNRILPE